MDKKAVEEQIEFARKGKLNWDTLVKEVEAEQYIILPHTGDEFNLLTAEYIEAYMEHNHFSKVVVIAADKLDLALFAKKKGVECKQMELEWIDSVLKYYALIMFSEHITIVSLTRPYDTCGMNLLGVHGITKRELLCYDILGFEEIPQV